MGPAPAAPGPATTGEPNIAQELWDQADNQDVDWEFGFPRQHVSNDPRSDLGVVATSEGRRNTPPGDSGPWPWRIHDNTRRPRRPCSLPALPGGVGMQNRCRSRIWSMGMSAPRQGRPNRPLRRRGLSDSEVVHVRRYAEGLDLFAGADSTSAPRRCLEQKSRASSSVVQPLTQARCWMMSFTGGRNRSMGLDTIKEFQQPSKSHRIAPRRKVTAPP